MTWLDFWLLLGVVVFALCVVVGLAYGAPGILAGLGVIAFCRVWTWIESWVWGGDPPGI